MSSDNERPTESTDDGIEEMAAALRGDGDTGTFDPVGRFPTGEMDLRAGADSCYKCSTCDTSCPVAEVDDSFPGPKFQGPEQWRLTDKEGYSIDDSITKCSNCMRCDTACPSEVPLSQMHNTLRGRYVDEELSKRSTDYWRNRILANYGTLARFGSKVPRLTNAVMGSSLVATFNERVLGITSEREFPAFATQTFREWWDARGGNAASKERAAKGSAARRAQRDGREPTSGEENDPRAARGGGEGSSEEKRVAYFHGDYANYNTPEVAKALVRVFEHYGYEVAVPEQRCSGTPMFANGMLDDARRAARVNVRTLSELVEEGYDVVCSCTSCSMALRQEYPELFDIDGIGTVAAHTYDALEYLRINEDIEGDLREASVDASNIVYHAPCHARNQGLDRQALELFEGLDDATVTDVGDSCSGISGTYGWKTETYETSMAIGEEMFEHMRAAPGETGMTECPTCAMQMNHGTGYEMTHPLQLVEQALVDA